MRIAKAVRGRGRDGWKVDRGMDGGEEREGDREGGVHSGGDTG